MTVYGYFTAWSSADIFTQLNYQLTGLARALVGARVYGAHQGWCPGRGLVVRRGKTSIARVFG
ncbi:hypothetical protein GCM10010429_04980 [Micromonospora olivasterospora]|uniref:Uncharacterized protein n=1 Tax=Micromonospora olivasterospora TaxID=1880 RepID=A0A562I8Q4_MICOL|nr:hypothetical protein [Micromonospora olivasterospora]TWH67272.1 hypothetical protein JD77_02244 [Micromonospora olivasterospora]